MSRYHTAKTQGSPPVFSQFTALCTDQLQSLKAARLISEVLTLCHLCCLHIYVNCVILQTAQYSTQIFSLAVLLSSLFVYNQMGGIDEAALDRLSLVTEMTKHIRVRAGSKVRFEV